MSFTEPTFEEFQKYKPFEVMRYKYGLIIIVLAWISILALAFYTVHYVEVLTTHPMQYTAEEFGLSCFCNNYEEGLSYIFNATEVKVQESQIRFGG